jgi:chaperonin cofactor prefoldin
MKYISNLESENDFLKTQIKAMTDDLANLRKEVQSLRLELLTMQGQCIEEHHWKGNCPNEQR